MCVLKIYSCLLQSVIVSEFVDLPFQDKCTEGETAASEASSQVSDRQQDEKSIVITPVDTGAEPPQPKPVSSSCLRTGNQNFALCNCSLQC